MNKTYKSLLAALAVAPMVLTTGCIEEVFPTNGVIQEQLNGNIKATEALVWAMPGHLNQYATVASDQHYDWGQGSIMHARDVMTADMSVVYSGYNWFSTWSSCSVALNSGYAATQFIWNFQTEQVLTTNKVVGGVTDTSSPEMAAYRGQGLAFRASTYLDMARMYEFLPNADIASENADGNDVLGYTVPIVTEQTTEEQARNNPRATHAEMVAFIKKDLEEAIPLLEKGTPRSSKTVPNAAVAYGLLARLYLWDATYHEEGLRFAGPGTAAELYQKAAEYARLAISKSGATPMTREQSLNKNTGFNDIEVSSWLWGGQYTDEDNAVKSALLNWTSWMSNETTFGYACAGPYVMIASNVYNRINDRDWRKLMFLAPEGSALSGQETLIDPAQREEFPAYASLKFRPGSGNMTDNNIACVVGYPLMRVEEMYFIEAEATAHSNPAAGLQLCSDFMKKFRNPSYISYATSMEDVIDEIVFQKRVELFGEGQSYFDYKRLNMGVDRTYSGTNFNWGQDTFKTTGRPWWMNFVITQQECDSNKGCQGWNNPNTGGIFKAASGK